MGSEAVVNTLTSDIGFLVVEVTPAEASVYLNGEEVGTGTFQDALAPGEYTVVGGLGQLYRPAREVAEVSVGKKRVVSLTLAPAFGRLAVTSEPARASVWVDDERVGVTPWSAEQKPSGTYRVRVSHPDYISQTRDVAIEDGPAEAHFDLSANFGALEVRSDPPEAAITLDGEPTGEVTPHTFERRRAGTAEVALELEGYGAFAERASVEVGETARIDAALQAKLGRLNLMATTSAGQPCIGPVRVDGERVGEAPLTLDLVAVRHSVQVTCGGGEVARGDVVVKHNEVVEARLKAPRPPPQVAGVMARGRRRLVTFERGRRYGFGGASAEASFVGGSHAVAGPSMFVAGQTGPLRAEIGFGLGLAAAVLPENQRDPELVGGFYLSVPARLGWVALGPEVGAELPLAWEASGLGDVGLRLSAVWFHMAWPDAAGAGLRVGMIQR